MDISNLRCTSCHQPMSLTRALCPSCNLVMEGEFEISPLARLALEDQMFVVAFIRHHGSIKKMESLFGISYPTVKNRLNAIGATLDRSFDATSRNVQILEQLSRGEITVDEALERMG
jgi:hypothetical protein